MSINELTDHKISFLSCDSKEHRLKLSCEGNQCSSDGDLVNSLQFTGNWKEDPSIVGTLAQVPLLIPELNQPGDVLLGLQD